MDWLNCVNGINMLKKNREFFLKSILLKSIVPILKRIVQIKNKKSLWNTKFCYASIIRQ